MLALENTGLARAMRQWTWPYPATEVVHILGFVLLIGSAAMFDLRLLGISRSLPVTTLARHLLPWARIGLLLAAPTGLLLFISDATATAANPAFRLKLVLIAAALLNAAVFHCWSFKTVAAWDQHAPTPISAKAAAVCSLALWTSTVAAGRLIAYV